MNRQLHGTWSKQPLQHFERDDRQHQDDGEEDQRALLEALTTAGFQIFQQRVGAEIQSRGDDGEQDDFHAVWCSAGIQPYRIGKGSPA